MKIVITEAQYSKLTEDNLREFLYAFWNRQKKNGEEPFYRRAAKSIIDARRAGTIETTTQLSKILERAIPKIGKIHPATLVFQALRICVNKELESIQTGIQKALQFLSTGGIIGVISFHSLEDRIVKQFFKSLIEVDKDPVTGMEVESPNFRLINKKPLKGLQNDNNPRARSAKLRVVEKIN